jgi:beta-galactosidase
MWTDGKSTHLYKDGEDSQLIPKTKWTDLQLNNVWKNAGVHIYTSPGDILYIGRNWLCVHSVDGEKKTVKFPFLTQVINPEKNDTISDYSEIFEFQMSPGTTRLFRLNSINSLKK